MTLASPTAILEPQITLHSVEDDNVILYASPEWKKKLIKFLEYAATTDDAEVNAFVTTHELEQTRDSISLQSRSEKNLTISKLHLLDIYQALLALNVLSPSAFYDYDADDFDRLHDDFFLIYETVFKEKTQSFRRIKTGLSAGFDG